jgi:hypothetical protein
MQQHNICRMIGEIKRDIGTWGVELESALEWCKAWWGVWPLSCFASFLYLLGIFLPNRPLFYQKFPHYPPFEKNPNSAPQYPPIPSFRTGSRTEWPTQQVVPLSTAPLDLAWCQSKWRHLPHVSMRQLLSPACTAQLYFLFFFLFFILIFF